MKLLDIIPEAFTAFVQRQHFKTGKVAIDSLPDGQFVLTYKHNPIASFHSNGVLEIAAPNTSQGVFDILSYILSSGMCAEGASILFAGDEMYLDGQPWSGYWTVVGLRQPSDEYCIVHNINS